jgi:hypothetical protein
MRKGRPFPLQIITCADAQFFEFLPYLEANISRKFGFLPTIYDLGMRDDQVRSLRSRVVPMPSGERYRSKHRVTGNVMTTHKPACIKDSLIRNPGGCLYVDADVLFVDATTEADFANADIAVTPRRPSAKADQSRNNGNINAGVLYFSGSAAARSILDEWLLACEDGDRTDQMALSDILEGFNLLDGLGIDRRERATVMKLNARVFNDVRIRTGRILHFKNAGRNEHARRKLAKFRRLEERFPAALSALFGLRRKIRGYH